MNRQCNPSYIYHIGLSLSSTFLLPHPFIFFQWPTSKLARVLVLHYLGEAAGSAVFASRCEVPELDVQQLHQLGHGPHCGGHIARTQETLGLLCQLPGHDRCRLPRTELGAKQG